MSDVDVSAEAGSNVELSNEPLSTEIGSGDVSEEAVAEAGLAAESSDEQQAAAEEVREVLEEAIEEGATPEEVQEIIETFKLKVNGKEKEVTLDWNNKEDIIRRLQMAEAGTEAMQKSADLEKLFDSEIGRLQSNPWEVLQELGLDPDALAEQRIEEQIARLQLTPEQLAQQERDSELEALRKQIKDQEEAEKQREFEAMQEKAQIDIDEQITKAISGTTELPKSPYIVKRVADAMLWAMENGYSDITAEQVIPTVEKEINGELQALFDAMPDAVLQKFIGKNTSERLRKGRLANKAPSAPKIPDSGKKVEKEEKEEKINMRDWLKGRKSFT